MNLQNKTIYYADNLDIMRAIDSDSIDLIYLDPPFNKRSTFVATDRKKIEQIKTFFIDSQKRGELPDFMLNDNMDEVFEDVKFGDEWKDSDIKPIWRQEIGQEYPNVMQYINGTRGISPSGGYHYLTFMAIRLVEMNRILKPTGSIYLHCDPTMSHYIKGIMDAIFGEKNFRNEIVWNYQRWTGATKNFQKMHDCILFYCKTKNNNFTVQTEPYSDKSKHKGQRFSTTDQGKVIKQEYVNEKREKAMSDVWDISILNSQAKERTGYPTQKPVALLNRIIEASSNKGDVVLDPFCGCATTCIAADRLQRKWVGIDISPQAAYMVYYRAYQEKLLKYQRVADDAEVRKQSSLFETLFNLQTQPPTPSDEKNLNRYAIIKEAETKALKNKARLQQELFHLSVIPEEKLTPQERDILKKTLYDDQGALCNGCLQYKRLIEMELDHIHPKSKGGADSKENIQLLCHTCNCLFKKQGTMMELVDKLRAEKLIPKEVYEQQKKRYAA